MIVPTRKETHKLAINHNGIKHSSLTEILCTVTSEQNTFGFDRCMHTHILAVEIEYMIPFQKAMKIRCFTGLEKKHGTHHARGTQLYAYDVMNDRYI